MHKEFELRRRLVKASQDADAKGMRKTAQLLQDVIASMALVSETARRRDDGAESANRSTAFGYLH